MVDRLCFILQVPQGIFNAKQIVGAYNACWTCRGCGPSAVVVGCVSRAWAAPCVAPLLAPEMVVQIEVNAQVRSLRTPIHARSKPPSGTSPETDPALAADLFAWRRERLRDFKRQSLRASPRRQAALLIQQAVGGFDNGQFQASFEAVAGNLSTAATNASGKLGGQFCGRDQSSIRISVVGR